MDTKQPGPGNGHGVVTRHSRRCARALKYDADHGYEPRCTCIPSYQAWVFVNGKKIRRTFLTHTDAVAWRRSYDSTLHVIQRARQAKRDYELAAAELHAHALQRGIAR